MDLEKAEEPEIELPTSIGSPKKQGSSRKTFTSASKSLTMWITTNWKILQEMGKSNHLTWLLSNIYADQEATVRTGHGTTDWFQIRKGAYQGCILSPCLFNLYAEYIMWNGGWMNHKLESWLPGEISNNLRCADDTTIRAEGEEELRSLLIKVKEESEKVDLKLSI